MKLSVAFCLMFCITFFNLNDKKNRRVYDDGEFLYEFYLAENNEEVKLKRGVDYFWYDLNEVNSSVYGFKGRVLNGKYTKSVLENGKIIEQGVFLNGVKNGEWKEWYNNGTLKKSQMWNNGYKEGKFLSFDEDSKLITKGSFYRGKKKGKWWYFSSEGKVLKTWYKDVLNGVFKEYKRNQLIIKGNYKKGLQEGIWEEKGKRVKYKKGKIVDNNVASFWDRFKEETKN